MYTIISCVHKMSGSIRCRNTGTGSLSHLTCCFSTTSLMQPCAHKSVWGDCLSTVPATVRLFQKCIIIIVTNITTTNSDLIVVDARVIAHAADSTQLFQSRVFTGFDLLAILVPEHTTKTCTYIYIYTHANTASHIHTYGWACKIYFLAWEIDRLLLDSTHPKLGTQAGSRSDGTEAAKRPIQCWFGHLSDWPRLLLSFRLSHQGASIFWTSAYNLRSL